MKAPRRLRALLLLLALAACSSVGQVRIAGHAIAAPPGFRLERPPSDFACYVPTRDLGSLGVSFCVRGLIKKGVLASNTFAIESYPLEGRTVEIRGLASDGSNVPDTVYLILETDDLFVFGECAGRGKGQELIDACNVYRSPFNAWLREILGT